MTADRPGPVPTQDVRFCRSVDGVRLAWAVHGSGPPLVVSSCWLSHLQYDWQSPVWRHFLDDLGDLATVVRYDERGFGLSDWDVTDLSLPSRLRDLEIVVDQMPHDRFALMGMSAGAPVAISYAVAHPERVSRLVLYGPILSGCFSDPDDDAVEEAMLAAIRAGWAREEPYFRRLFTSVLIPEATEEQMVWLDELQRMSTSAENAVASRVARRGVDIVHLLDRVEVPTLVLHARGDRAAPFGAGCEVSSRVRGARLVPLDSRNHILLGDEPAWPVFREEVARFLEPDRAGAVGTGDASTARGGSLPPLSPREAEVVGLVAAGLDNREIATRLVLSVRTVERHLQNVYLKAGLPGRTGRSTLVARYLSTARESAAAG